MNHYEVQGLIGEGAYGSVLKAKNKDNGSIVAIKKFKETDDDELIKKTIVRELKVLKSLRHKNIVELNEAFRKKGIVYLVFEYLDYNLLEVVEKNNRGLPSRQIAKYIYQVLQGLEYMHSLNYLHRDIKPQNLLVNAHGIVKICDMGFAKLHDSKMTDYVATRWYRPPQLLIGLDYGSQIDIWAVGCIMAELSDTQPLFPGSCEIDQLEKIISKLGSLPTWMEEVVANNQAFKRMIPAKKSSCSNYLDKYKNKLSEQGVDLLKKMLTLDPKQRITAKQALQHPYFQTFRTKNQRFRKTSHAWITCKMQNKLSLKDSSNTERGKQESLKIPAFENIENDKDSILRTTKGSKFLNMKSEEIEKFSKHNLAVNKIYHQNEKKKNFLLGMKGSQKDVRGFQNSRWMKTMTNLQLGQKKWKKQML